MNIVWSISQLDVNPQEEGMTDVVVTAHWSCAGTDGDYSASIINTTMFSPPVAKNFIPYTSLTEDEVLNWVWNSGVDKFVTESAVVQMIDNQINPPVISPKLPWA